ncbi:MarR family winged helix-turn-helix transcriptional regulator [Chloroflexota bacterium]
MEEKVIFDGDFKIWSIFNQASEAAIKTIDNELFRNLEISYIQLGVMYVVKNSSNRLSPTEISRVLLREPHTMAALINRMEKQGLIKKTKDHRMKNIKRISLTRKGEEFYTKAMAVGTPSQLLSCLSPEEKESLRVCSEKIRNEALRHLTIRRLWEPLFG